MLASDPCFTADPCWIALTSSFMEQDKFGPNMYTESKLFRVYDKSFTVIILKLISSKLKVVF